VSPADRAPARLVADRAFAALVDAVVAPEPPLPPVGATDAVAAFAAWLARAPRLNRIVLRAALVAVGLARSRAARLAVLKRLGPVGEALRPLAAACYYGDAGVLRVLGYRTP
jgi:hypothetical protein